MRLSGKTRTALLGSLTTLCVLFNYASLVVAQNANSATTLEDRNIPRFQQQVERMNQGDVDVLWIGDSITHFWETNGKAVWDKYYGDRKAMNFGISGDRTGHVLWRMANAPMDKISPKIAIVLIGVNNIAHKKSGSDEPFSTPEETVDGIKSIVDNLKTQYPTTKVLLLNVFPCCNQPTEPWRVSVNKINAGLETIYADSKVENVQLYNIGDLFLDEKGVLSSEYMPDYVHPSEAGYEIWAKAVEPIVADALGEEPEECKPVDVNADWWPVRFNEKNEILKKGDVDLLMVGDSITHFWDKTPYWPTDGSEAWEKYFGDKKAVNLGHGGDRTQNILWRLDHYDFSAVQPKAAVLLIGVNNTWNRDYDPKNVALGQRRCVQKMRALFPDARIVVLAIFPCASREDQQACNDAINALTPYYVRDIPNVEFLDINKVFLNDAGVLTKDVMPDLLHPNGVGYEAWGAALAPVLEPLFK